MNHAHKLQTLAAMLTAVQATLANLAQDLDRTCERVNKATDLVSDHDGAMYSNEATGAALHAQAELTKVQELLAGMVALNNLRVRA